MITLSEEEQLICRWVAKSRYEAARAANVTDQKVGPQSTEETDLSGFGGEMAFCRMFNLFPDFTIGPRCVSNDKGDAMTHKGKVVDVKTTPVESGCLLVPFRKIATIDLYVLMIGTFPTYRCAGYLSRDEVAKKENIGDKGHGPCYVLRQESLRKIKPPVNR